MPPLVSSSLVAADPMPMHEAMREQRGTPSNPCDDLLVEGDLLLLLLALALLAHDEMWCGVMCLFLFGYSFRKCLLLVG